MKNQLLPTYISGLLITGLIFTSSLDATIVINEILYHAPNDQEELDYIELFNTSDSPVNLAGMKFTQGVDFTFSKEASLDAGAHLVLCRNLEVYKTFFQQDAYGQYGKILNNKGETVQISDASGNSIDEVKYGDRFPWPVSADGYGASLERICPTSPGNVAANWTASGFASDPSLPYGSPGRKNFHYSKTLPPILELIDFEPMFPEPGQAIKVRVKVGAKQDPTEVILNYQIAGSGIEEPVQTVPMQSRTTDAKTGQEFEAIIPGQSTGALIRFFITVERATEKTRRLPATSDLRPTYSAYVDPKPKSSPISIGRMVHIDRSDFEKYSNRAHTQRSPRKNWKRGFRAAPAAPLPSRGNAAFIYYDPKSQHPELFDYVQMRDRSSGFKIKFHKDRLLNGMGRINLINEGVDRFIMAEHLAYILYRLAGIPVEKSEPIRLQSDDHTLGLYLLVEQPNRTFLKRNGLNGDGNLYKILWYERSLVRKHEKKTHLTTGHQDLRNLNRELNATTGKKQWDIIRQHFDVEEVINYFAVNMVLSHWDGYFNNYFTYHDSEGTGKWQIYPWDQDKTWGFHDGIGGSEVFSDMPLTFGMTGDQPPQSGFSLARLLFGNRNRAMHQWWRPPGFFSGPLLANKEFRRHYLARIREILDNIYTETIFFPIIHRLENDLKQEFIDQAQARGQMPESALAQLDRNTESLKEHLVKRREFLLQQKEIRNAGSFDPNQLR